MYPPGADNIRRMHENAIRRMERMTQSDKFKEMDGRTLNVNLEMLKKSFNDFSAEHQKLITTLRDPSKFNLEDQFHTTIQECYTESIIRFEIQKEKMEREESLRSMARRTRDGAKVAPPQTKERELTPKQQQQKEHEREQRRRQQYEHEQRQQRIVQMNDSIIHKQRTKEWVNRLSINNDHTDLELERQRINQELEVLDRQQMELDERANQLKLENRRERSRSPVQFHVNIPSSMQVRSNELNQQSSSTSSAKNRQLTGNFRNIHLSRDSVDGANTSHHSDVDNVHSAVVTQHSSDLRNKIERSHGVKCHFCGENHKMYRCQRFLNLKRNEREQHVSVLKLCKNCFMPLEDGRHRCRFGRCENCGVGKFHNSLLCPMRYPE